MEGGFPKQKALKQTHGSALAFATATPPAALRLSHLRRGAAGNNSLHLDEGRGCLIRGFPYPSSLPTLSHVGISFKQHITVVALVGAFYPYLCPNPYRLAKNPAKAF